MRDWELHLSTLFPEVRLKRYIELRGADAGPMPMAAALGALWRGLLDDRDARAAAWELVAKHSFAEREALRREVPRAALRARLGGRPLQELALELVRISRRGLARLPGGEDDRPLLAPLWALRGGGTDAGRRPARRLRRRRRRSREAGREVGAARRRACRSLRLARATRARARHSRASPRPRLRSRSPCVAGRASRSRRCRVARARSFAARAAAASTARLRAARAGGEAHARRSKALGRALASATARNATTARARASGDPRREEREGDR